VPKIRRQFLPSALYDHLLDRVHQRQTTGSQLREFLKWLDAQPEVPQGKWFKRFAGMIVCGEGELVKMFLTAAQIPFGTELL